MRTDISRSITTPRSPKAGSTEITNLAGVCHFHHAYKHTHNLRLAGVGTNQYFVTARAIAR